MELIRRNTPEYFAAEEEIDLSDYLDREIESYYVLVTNDRIVGCGGINFADDKTVGKISWDIIHPDYQGKSLGKFYQKQGFVLKTTHKDYWAKGIDWSMKEIRTPLYFKM